MKFPWAICLAREDAGSLAPLRLQTGIEVAEIGTALWIRGRFADDALSAKLAALPATGRFEWLETNQLRALHERIPGAALPTAQWQSLAAWLRITLPIAALPGDTPAPVALRLVRSVEEREPQLLLTTVTALKEFVATTGRVRQERLTFAAAFSGAVLVRGRPLPPLPGRRFVLFDGVAIPAGFRWTPAVSPAVLARKLGVSGDALVLWNEDGTITRLHSEQFVAVNPAAVRATEEGLA